MSTSTADKDDKNQKRKTLSCHMLLEYLRISSGFSTSIPSLNISNLSTPRKQDRGPQYTVCSPMHQRIHRLVQCRNQTGKCMSQHKTVRYKGQDSAVHLHLKDKGHSLQHSIAHALDREDGFFYEWTPLLQCRFSSITPKVVSRSFFP